ncbi:general transcription factor 3C polypeptide 2-like [Macrosteles quadrilineatus]|uniref:general transcription factor 3C polypeptide 2-like n=1 Tax=Macrosteles quadrilineatus TaxID=74068 RepID=UPI0023E12D10|nr:general transcription factor 3C polypeptide 2-like [Macrosteles quadrilineatus]
MFAKERLYPEAQCQTVPGASISSHLPELTESIRFQGSDGVWQKLQRFQASVLDGVAVLFAGGPVWSVSWAPIPDYEDHQYLALATHTNVESTHEMSSLYNYPGIIQIWALGAIKNTTREAVCPHMVVGIAQRRGPVWGLAWCPAGVYTQDRIGLLAAACGDGNVVVYAVPHKTNTSGDPMSNCLSLKPVWELKLGCEMMSQCTCVDWHSAAPHSVIAGGFANGMVALWDLATTSPLLKSGSTLLPFKVIEAHQSAVKSVKLSCTEGIVYMMSASLDRTAKFWNLDDTRAPVSFLRKACVTDAVMTNNWLMSINSYDDVYSLNNSHVTGCTFRDFFTSANANFVMQPGTVWGLSFNDWLNGCAYASEMGKVSSFFRQQLLVTEDSKKINKSAFIEDLATCTAHSIKDDSVLTRGFGTMYRDCVSTMGLKFEFGGKLRGGKSTVCSSDNMDSFPIRSFNTVSWNQNMNSFVWLAAGMQCGLVVVPRVSSLHPNDLIELEKLKDNL